MFIAGKLEEYKHNGEKNLYFHYLSLLAFLDVGIYKVKTWNFFVTFFHIVAYFVIYDTESLNYATVVCSR